ncbi:hypothetical protein QJS66_05175 [Kocuria rhizophila]|nr:hypothetical protein QJS66_05175 [Kocuria rhizophila]
MKATKPREHGLLAGQPLRGHPHPDHGHQTPRPSVWSSAPDPSCNPYLAFAARLMAGLDGIRNRIEPADPVDKDLYELPEEAKDVRRAPTSLEEALKALEDHEFLLAGDVFTEDLMSPGSSTSASSSSSRSRWSPPLEFQLYYGV